MKVGDLVRLRSGSPRMTVNSVDGIRIQCVWYEGDNLKVMWFTREALRAMPSISSMLWIMGFGR